MAARVPQSGPDFAEESGFPIELWKERLKYQPSGAGGTRLPPATPHHLQHLTAYFIQNGRRGLERV